jgi:glucosylceramidase
LNIRFLDAYKDHGIDFWGLTVENEPVEGQNPRYGFNCLYLDPELERDFVVLNLGPTLEKAGYGADKINLMIFDENLGPIVKWADTILGAKNASKFITGIAFHAYTNNAKNILNMDTVREKYPNYFLLSTENCILRPPNIGNWLNGETYANDIIRVISYISFQ